jgi:membrane peptidoglycan carboxypeptidase
VRILAVALLFAGASAGTAEAYVDSVPFPAAHTEPQASVLYYRDGTTVLARVGTTDHSDVPLASVPEPVREAVLAAEDRDFYDHGGVSVRGVLRAAVSDLSGGREGASTITQQYVRNAYLTQDFSVERKAREAALSIKLERRLGKDQILERYLNSIYFGRGAYGIAAAAHAYFGVTVDRLTAAQGAVLAGAVKDPYLYDPANDAVAARQRWDWIVAAERGLGRLRGTVAYPAVAEPRSSVAGPMGVVVDQVERELGRHGVTAQQLHTQGLSVVTTIDRAAQKAATDRIGAALAGQPQGLQAALVAVDPLNGGVRAYYGGDRGRGYFDYAAALHPAASTFKPIVLAAAMRAGIGYDSRWDGSSPRIFPGRLGVPLRNHDNMSCASCTLEQSMVDSLNTPFYAVTEQLGADAVRTMAVQLGISRTYGGQQSMVDVKGDPQPGRTRADIAIGRYPVTPGDLASVYATFASGGTRYDRYIVQSARAGDGRQLWQATATGARVLPQTVADDVSTVLGAVVRGEQVGPDRPAAGKTGTQQYGNSDADVQDAWMAGYTPDLAAAVWIGRAVPGPIRDAAGKPIEGKTLPATLWRGFLTAALHAKPKVPLPKPAHVGRTDVGDAGKTHDNGKSPDQTGTVRPADPGYAPVVHTAHEGKRLALTFDDGPSADTPAVLDLLAKYHIKATFCIVGENATWYPATVKRIVAEGHALCNHSMHHDDLGAMSDAKARADIEAADAAIAAAVPGETVTYYRAPYGDFGRTAKIAASMGHTPLGWLVDPDDWTLPGASVIAQRIGDGLTPRAVVLVHDGGGDRKQTVTALTGLIPKLLGEGWQFDLPQVTQKAHPLPAQSSSAPSLPAASPSDPSPSGPSPSDPATPGEKPGETGEQPGQDPSAEPSLSTSSTNHSSS